MGGDDEPVRAPLVVVVVGDQFEHRGGQVVLEGGPVGGRAATNPRVDAQRRQALAGGVGPARQGADLAHQPAGQRDEVARREVVGVGVRVGRGRAEGRRGDDVGGRRGLQHPLGDAAVPALLGQPHQAVRLERLQVVVDLLARDADPGGEPGGGGRHGQFAEQPGPDRVQSGGGRLRVLDDLDVLHDSTVRLTRNVVKGSRGTPR